MALSYNTACKVVTFDVLDCVGKTAPTLRTNVTFKIENILDDIKAYLDCPLMVLDTAHDGVFETAFIQRLGEVHYRGIVICDDINLNNEMRTFWKSIPHKTVDLTSVGHWSGTGAIVFDPEFLDIECTA